MRLHEYRSVDATELARLIRDGALTPEEAINLAHEAIEKFNPSLNAVVSHFTDPELYSDQLVKKDAPLYGVPILAKDLLQDYAGAPITSGSKALKDVIALEHSELMEGFLKAGLVCLGHTNTPELGLMGMTEPEAYGPTKNPWDPSLTSGGSSGGSAAAVASGMVPIAGAGDGGGSIRIPAACCGLVGLKVTRGRITPTKRLPSWDGAVVEGVLTRSVRDTALMLEQLQNPALASSFKLGEIKRDQKFRIGFSTHNPLTNAPVEQECRESVEQAAEHLRATGHEVEEINFAPQAIKAARAYLMMYFAHVGAEVDSLLDKYGRTRLKDFELTTRLLHHLGQKISASQYTRSRQTWIELQQYFNSLFTRHDLILTSTLGTAPLPHFALGLKPFEKIALPWVLKLNLGRLLLMTNMVDEIAYNSLAKLPYTFLTNLSGHPSINIPWARESNSRPVGLHVTAPYFREAHLLSLAFEIEKSRPWSYPGLN
jgi:amidase